MDNSSPPPIDDQTQASDSIILNNLKVDIAHILQEIDQIKDRSFWLMSMVVGLMFLLGGASIWFHLQSQEQDKDTGFNAQDSAVKAGIAPTDLERLGQVEAQLDDLQRQISEEVVSEQKENQVQLQAIQEQLRAITVQSPGNQELPISTTETAPDSALEDLSPLDKEIPEDLNSPELPSNSKER